MRLSIDSVQPQAEEPYPRRQPAAASPGSVPLAAAGQAELVGPLPRFSRGRHVDEVRRLSQVSNWWSAFTIARQWVVILAAATAAVWVGTWWSYLCGALVIGSRQQALGVLVHDGTHYLLFTNRFWNDLICDLTCAFPVGLSTSLYRKTHLRHHRYTNTENDPDWVLQQADEDFRFPKTPREAWALFLKSLFGLNLHKMKNVLVHWSPGANLFTPLGRDFPLTNRVAFVLSTAAVYAVLISTGWWLPALWLYALPALTLFHFFNRMRATAEHICTPGTHELNATRTVLASPLEKLLIAPCGVHYHLEHHLFPSVPCRNLGRLHEQLMHDDEFRSQAHLTRSYFGVRRGLLGELLRHPGDASAEAKASE